MNVQLSPDAVRFVEDLVASGQFESAEAAIAEGVQLLKSQHQLRAEIQKGIDDADAGRVFDGKEVFADLREKASKLTKSADCKFENRRVCTPGFGGHIRLHCSRQTSRSWKLGQED